MTPDRAKLIGWHPSDGLLQVGGAGAVLALFLARIRWGAAGFTWGHFLSGPRVRELISLAYYDLLYVTVMSAAFVGLLLLAGRRPRAGRMVARLYVPVAVLSLIMA